jgi:hypothetical protein
MCQICEANSSMSNTTTAISHQQIGRVTVAGTELAMHWMR